MNTTYQTCNFDCIENNAKTVFECYDECEECVTDKGCWATATYGDSTDQDCYNNCYITCEDFFGEASDLCDCADHGTCVFGCPENCTVGDDFEDCNEDCKGNGGDPYDCLTYCTTCTVDNTCWTTLEYGTEDDFTCWDECYTICDDNLGASSDFCVCNSHNQCILGCPENCTPTDSFQVCNDDCVDSQGYDNADTCAEFCNDCVGDKGCWAHATAYGDADD
jgi:hypothetical protein